MNTKPIKLFMASGMMLILFSTSCRKEKQFDKTPQVTFKSVEQTDSTGFKIVIGFNDGDGDIGFEEGDTLPPFNPGSIYYYNYFLKIFYKENGILKEYITPFPYNYRIPTITPGSRNKNITGDISLDVFFFPIAFDTLQCEAYILDRALNQSNIAASSEFVFN